MTVILPTLSIAETQEFSALREFLLSVCSPNSGPNPLEVIKAQSNRVPEPVGPNFIIMTPLLQERIGTNYTTYGDNIVTGSISLTTLTVTSIAQGSLAVGQVLIDSGYPTMNIQVGTQILQQLTGAPGGIGTYEVSISQILSSETLYAGVRDDLEQVQLTIQLDIHGPSSADNVRVLETLFRSEYATTSFANQVPYVVTPLYCSDAIQTVFENAEQQMEYRWTIDAVIQVNPVIGTPQQFADRVEIEIVVADA